MILGVTVLKDVLKVLELGSCPAFPAFKLENFLAKEIESNFTITSWLFQKPAVEYFHGINLQQFFVYWRRQYKGRSQSVVSLQWIPRCLQEDCLITWDLPAADCFSSCAQQRSQFPCFPGVWPGCKTFFFVSLSKWGKLLGVLLFLLGTVRMFCESVQHEQVDISSISVRWLKDESLTFRPFSVINLTVFLNPCQIH